MKKTCSNCKHLIPNDEGEDNSKGKCFEFWGDYDKMRSNQVALWCMHDGPIFVGKDFCCVNWEGETNDSNKNFFAL